MKAESFVYKGITFKPVGNILGGFFVKSGYTTLAYTLEIEGYDYKEFYKLARKHHASVDVFEVDGKLYMPNNARFMGLYNNPPIKTMDEYERWYH